MNYIHVGSINRSGGSLLMRLFDAHPDVASYPIEVGFPKDLNLYPWVDYLNGTPLVVPDFDPGCDKDLLKFHGIREEKEEAVHKWGKERADSVGVRKNYLEKVFYGKVETDFDYSAYIQKLKDYGRSCQTLQDAYDAKHRAYFEAWDDGKHGGGMKFVVTHDSGGIFVHNLDKYFEEFKTSIFVYPIRGVFGYIASEKTRITRRFYGSRRFPKFKMPNYFVKTFRTYDLNALIRTWLIAVTRVVILQEKYGVDGKFVVYRYENLLDRTEDVMRNLCKKSGLFFDKRLLTPTIAGQPWGGSSHQGKQKGINKQLAHYYKNVLRDDEIDEINKQCGPILEFLGKSEETPTDLTKIDRKILYDYDLQKKYSADPEKWALYSAYGFTSMRRVLIWAPNFTAVAAYFYSQFIRMIHIPRLLKLRIFPGWGKQNYT